MSTPDQEAQALDRAWEFLLALSSGEYRVDSIRRLRADARAIARHYPLAAGYRWTEKGGWRHINAEPAPPTGPAAPR